MMVTDKITGYFSRGVFNLTPSECYRLALSGRLYIIDIREPYLTNFKRFGLEEVICLPYGHIKETDIKDLIKKKENLAVADSAGLKSREVVLYLNSLGFNDIFNMAGGFIEWERERLPVDVSKGYRLSGSCMCQIKAREKDDNQM